MKKNLEKLYAQIPMYRKEFMTHSTYGIKTIVKTITCQFLYKIIHKTKIKWYSINLHTKN